ncbi:MAG: hypothetical protein KDC57_12615 [Saprospiraceae bacterium]|nr:hypothetical protein [Saprospiraceae bacterium]
MLIGSVHATGHPTGNMISVGEYVYWSYINPVDDPSHYACIMIWKKGSDPAVFLQSKHPASDYMLYNKNDHIYIIERKYSSSTDDYEVRLLKSTHGKKPEIIWDWFKDEYRIGEGGFIMLSDDQMIFGRYPNVYKMKRGSSPTTYFKFNQAIVRVRAVEQNNILLSSDSACYLVDQNGTILKQWDGLIDDEIENAPLNRNQIFDADYSEGELLFAHWGKRSFEVIEANGNRKKLLQLHQPLTPHWVAFTGKKKMLFASRLIMDGSTPKPHLILLEDQYNQEVVWSIP